MHLMLDVSMLLVPAAQEVNKLALAHEAELEISLQVLSHLRSATGGFLLLAARPVFVVDQAAPHKAL